jgi:hypothetical protein
VFFEKITDAERVLITVLYQRQVCTRKVLAELFEVTPTTIGIACRRVEMTNRFTTWNQVVGLSTTA